MIQVNTQRVRYLSFLTVPTTLNKGGKMLYHLLGQKNLLLFTFYRPALLTTCLSLFTLSYALPFQEPVAGDYQCFSSEESIFDENARDIGASLTIATDSSYTFTTSSASENGGVTVSEDTSADLNDFFQSGSSLVLQPSSGSASYEAMFVIDKQGGMYIFLQNNNGLTIRCQSAGADIANAIKQIATEQAATEAPTTQPTNTPESSGTTEATGTPEPSGSYDEALSTVWTNGKIAVMTKEWCDARAPALQTSNAQAFETWQAEQFFYEIEAKFSTLMGTTFLTLEEKMSSQQEDLFASFDSSLGYPVSACQNLLTTLTENYNLRQQFPNEYAMIEAGSGESLTGETITLPNLGDVTAGGPLEPGDYQCLTAADNSAYTEELGFPDWVNEYVLSFYADMGLRLHTGDRDYETTFIYNQATGELDADNDYDITYESGIGETISNYFYASDYGDTIRSFKFYRDTQNQPVLYGVSDNDTSDEDIVTTLCRYASVAQRPSPAAEAAAQVEAERFKYVTVPGQGLQLADIEGIIHTGESVYTVTGLQFQEATYLLLRDGSIYKNLQVPPADLNVADSKQYEQENWGQWQRNADAISVQWYGSNEWLNLGSSLVQPAQADERLDVSYNNLTGSTTGMIGFGGTVSTNSDTITFMPDGRFEKSSYSTFGSTVNGPNFSMNSNYYSDEEGTVGGTSSSSTIGDTSSGVSVTNETTNPNPPATTGTYTLDGYTLELRYDDGRITRSFFYFWDDKKDNAVIGGVTYSLE
jgi:hypothetical protein